MKTRSFRPIQKTHDFYDVLGVGRDADADEIKRAFRARSRTLHPDVSPDPEAHSQFGELSDAYAVLSRPDSRRLYDRFGWRGRGGGFEPRLTRAYASNRRGFLEDLENLIAAAAGQRPEQSPAEVVGSVELDPYEAHVGTRRVVEVSTERPCGACHGTGHHRVISNRESGRFVSFDACADCGGTGVAAETRALNIPVPPGVRDLDRVPVGLRQVAIVKIVPPRERVVVQTAAFAGLLAAFGFFLFLLAL
jgi:molecular chaperone DnaJ